MTETTTVTPASALKIGSRIKLKDQELTIANIAIYGNWIELWFTKPMWDPIPEKWTQQFGCHYGFCIEVINS